MSKIISTSPIVAKKVDKFLNEVKSEKSEVKTLKFNKQESLDTVQDNKSFETPVRRTRSAIAKEEEFKTAEFKTNYTPEKRAENVLSSDKSKLVCFDILT